MSASNITVGATNVSLWTTYILRKFVPGLKANLIFSEYAEPAMIPKGAGGYIARWNVPTMRVGSVSSLTDGSSGAAANAVTITGVEATIADYGEWFNISDLANESDVTGALDVYKDIVTYAGSGAIDTLLYNAAAACTTFLHSGDAATAGVTLASGDVAIATDLAAIAANFRTNNAVGFEKLSGDYMWAIHPGQEFDIVTDVTNTRLSWSEVNKHVPAGFDQLINTHRFVGRLGGVSIMRTTIIGTVTEDIAAYKSVALARWGLGWLGLGENGPKAPSIKMKQPGPQSTNDPLDTNNTLGWKVRAVARLLDNNRVMAVYSDAA